MLLRLPKSKPKPRFLCKTEQNWNRGFRRPNSRFGFKRSALRYASLFCMNYIEVNTSLAAREWSMQTSQPKSAVPYITSITCKPPEAKARWRRVQRAGVSIGQPLADNCWPYLPVKWLRGTSLISAVQPLLTQLVCCFSVGCLITLIQREPHTTQNQVIEVNGDLPQCYCFVIRQREKNFKAMMQQRWQAGLADGRRDLGGLIIIVLKIVHTVKIKTHKTKT